MNRSIVGYAYITSLMGVHAHAIINYLKFLDNHIIYILLPQWLFGKMPYLSIQTNTPTSDSAGQALLKKTSKLVSQQLGKPESYVMVALPAATPMLFAGSDEASAYLQLKSIDLDEKTTTGLSNALCSLISAELGISQDRVYIEFSNAQRHLWGWNGATC